MARAISSTILLVVLISLLASPAGAQKYPDRYYEPYREGRPYNRNYDPPGRYRREFRPREPEFIPDYQRRPREIDRSPFHNDCYSNYSGYRC
jgi:hypothetical protein